MRMYVVRPTSAAAVAACHAHGFGVLLSPLYVRDGRIRDMSGHVKPLQGLPYVLDNGAWACHVAGVEWSEGPFLRMLERLGLDDRGRYRAGLGNGFAVLPDVVGDSEATLQHSIKWWEQHRGGVASEAVAHWLLAVQDGMTPATVKPVLQHYKLDIFVGGSTAWKWATVHEWAELGLEIGARVHVGRVNSLRRAELCRDLGITSCDGSSVSRFANNAAKMARAHDAEDVLLPPPGRAREYLPASQRKRIETVERRARSTIARRRFELALGAAA